MKLVLLKGGPRDGQWVVLSADMTHLETLRTSVLYLPEEGAYRPLAAGETASVTSEQVRSLGANTRAEVWVWEERKSE